MKAKRQKSGNKPALKSSEYGAKVKELYTRAWKAFKKGDFGNAGKYCFELTKQFPKFPDGWYLASHLALKQKLHDQSLSYVNQAIALEQNNIAYWIQKVRCHLALGNVADSVILLDGIREKCPDRAEWLDTIGNLYSLCNKQYDALHCFEKSAALDSKNAHYKYNLATMRQAVGDIEGAEKAFDDVINLSPDDYDAHLLRSRLRKQSISNNHINELSEKLENTSNRSGKIKLGFALGKEYEDLEEYDRAFLHINRSAELRRSGMQYNVAAEIKKIEDIIQYYTKQLQNSSPFGYKNNKPVFIVGLPRTGTTLVEHILASHSQISTAGELDNFPSEMMALMKEQFSDHVGKSYRLVELTTQLDFGKLGEKYINSTKHNAGDAKHLVDKLPLNILYCGLIHLALPQAKIIHVTRSPMDACWAIYKTLFERTYAFSYNLEELASYYEAYYKLGNHWRNTIPANIFLDVSYEELVRNQEAVTRKIMTHCNVDWEPEVLTFYKQNIQSMTASAAQVRQPISDRSVGLWRNYEKYLLPLKNKLELAGISPE